MWRRELYNKYIIYDKEINVYNSLRFWGTLIQPNGLQWKRENTVKRRLGVTRTEDTEPSPPLTSSCRHTLHPRVCFKFLHENKPVTGSHVHTQAAGFHFDFFLWELFVYDAWFFFFSFPRNLIKHRRTINNLIWIPNRRPRTSERMVWLNRNL